MAEMQFMALHPTELTTALRAETSATTFCPLYGVILYWSKSLARDIKLFKFYVVVVIFDLNRNRRSRHFIAHDRCNNVNNL